MLQLTADSENEKRPGHSVPMLQQDLACLFTRRLTRLPAQLKLPAFERMGSHVEHQREPSIVHGIATGTVVMPAEFVSGARKGLNDATDNLAQDAAASDFLQPTQNGRTAQHHVQRAAAALGRLHFTMPRLGGVGDKMAAVTELLQSDKKTSIERIRKCRPLELSLIHI